MEADPTRMCEKLVGLGEVDLVGINDPGEEAPLEVVIGSRKPRPQAVKKLRRAGQAAKSRSPSKRSLDRMLRRVERWNAQVRANALDELRAEGY